jgi:hypothetical protein
VFLAGEAPPANLFWNKLAESNGCGPCAMVFSRTAPVSSRRRFPKYSLLS